MTRLLAYLRSLLISQVYVVLDGGTCVGVSGRLQGAELLRARHARALAVGMDGRVADEDYRTCYDRQRIENFELGDVW
ncbi:Gp53 [uncultured Mycobacterium sp.]|uniref:Gp53 n=1 Tax=uncultured Mycobacterium sp. TaxID=171292 RepID=A0A1Y5P8L2_9MYCO|nr:Gp53 [uncultured Mycobacterium sp.]